MRNYTKEPIWNILKSKKEFSKEFNSLLNNDLRNELLKDKEKIENVSNKIKFIENTHRYFYNNTECISVSNLVDLFVQKTDFDKVAERYALKNGLTKDIWKQRWSNKGNIATTTGTFVHQFCEDLTNIINNKETKLKQWTEIDDYIYPISSKCIAAYKYFIDCLNYQEFPFLAEVKLVWPEYFITGTFDQLIYSIPKKGFIIRDYKTNEIMTKSFKKGMLFPFENLNDEPLSHYIIQQNVYEIFLNLLGIKILNRELVWLKSNETYELIELPDIKDKIKMALTKI